MLSFLAFSLLNTLFFVTCDPTWVEARLYILLPTADTAYDDLGLDLPLSPGII